jgi:hypothetical protein
MSTIRFADRLRLAIRVVDPAAFNNSRRTLAKKTAPSQ